MSFGCGFRVSEFRVYGAEQGVCVCVYGSIHVSGARRRVGKWASKRIMHHTAGPNVAPRNPCLDNPRS